MHPILSLPSNKLLEPKSSISPLLFSQRPSKILIKVVLPAPFLPINP